VLSCLGAFSGHAFKVDALSVANDMPVLECEIVDFAGDTRTGS
jgi:hypothetical protein